MAIKTMQLSGLQMDYIVFGRGSKTLVILPGMSMLPVINSAAAIESAYKDFTDEYTVYLFERTKNMTDGYTIPEMAEDTARVMEALGLSDCYLFGASQGGMIAMCIAMEHPSLVKKMVLASTLSKPNEVSGETFPLWAELADTKDTVAVNRESFRRVYSPEFLASVSDALPELEKQGTAEDCARYAIMARSIINFDIYDKLSAVKCPTFVIGSKRDNVLSAEGSKQIAENCIARFICTKDTAMPFMMKHQIIKSV